MSGVVPGLIVFGALWVALGFVQAYYQFKAMEALRVQIDALSKRADILSDRTDALNERITLLRQRLDSRSGAQDGRWRPFRGSGACG